MVGITRSKVFFQLGTKSRRVNEKRVSLKKPRLFPLRKSFALSRRFFSPMSRKFSKPYVVLAMGTSATALSNSRACSRLAMQIGASSFVNSYTGARRGPNAAVPVKTTCGPNSGAVELVVRTANSVGIASKQEILLHYGMHFDLSQQMSDFFQPQKLLGTIEIQTCILLSNWATHEVPHWKVVWMLFFNKGSIGHLIIWKTLHLKASTHIWLSKVNMLALLKERWRKGLLFFFHPQKLLGTIEYHPNIYIIE